MTLLTQVFNVWLTALVAIGVLAVVFLALTRFSPCNPGQNWWTDRRAALTDLVYWLVLPLVTQVGRVALLVVGVLLVYGNAPPDDWAVRRWPLWVQCLGILLIQDVLLYWLHRLFHTRGGWRFHAVHHSPEVLDWTSTQRFHPVNAVLEFAVADVTVLLLGFSPDALILLGPINLAYSVMVHANLNWTFGPLRFLLVSPVYHRWHHTTAEEGRDRNFASTFPFLDLLFGTYHMPVGRLPEVYGTGEGDVPRGFAGQMAYPFRGVGAWAGRHPAVASVGGVAAIAGCIFGVMRLMEPVEAPEPPTSTEVATAPTPDVGKLTPVPGGSTAASVAVSVRRSQVFLGRSDGSLVVRDGAGEERTIPAHTGRVNALAVSPSENLIATGGGDGTARIWNADTLQPVRALRGHEAGVMSVAVADDGWAVTGTADGVVRVWTADGELAHVHRTGVPAPVHAVAVGDGGTRVAAAQLSTAFVWDTAANRTVALAGHTDLVYSLGCRADGGAVVSGGYDGRVKVWDAAGKCVATLSGHDGPVYAVALTRDGKRVISGGADQTVRVWRPGGELVRVLGGHAGLVFAASADDAGRRIAATGKDGIVSVWEVPDADVVPTGATTPGR